MRYAVKVKSLKDLWNNLKNIRERVVYIAGGTDVVLKINKDFSNFVIVDISDVKEMNIIEKRGDSIFVGGAVKINDLIRSPLIKRYAQPLYKSADYYASYSIRNMATLGGNLANASPCADGVLALCALKAKAVLNLYGKRRSVDVEEVIIGVKKTILKEREIIEGFILPAEIKKTAYIKIMPRKTFGIAKAALCISAYSDNGFLYDVRVVCSSVGPRIIFARNVSDYLEGKKITDEVIERAKEIIKTEITPITDHRSTSDYRVHVTSVMLERAVHQILND